MVRSWDRTCGAAPGDGRAPEAVVHSVFYDAVRCSFFFQAEDGIRDKLVTGVQTCALPICRAGPPRPPTTGGRPPPRSPGRTGALRAGGRGGARSVAGRCRARWRRWRGRGRAPGVPGGRLRGGPRRWWSRRSILGKRPGLPYLTMIVDKQSLCARVGSAVKTPAELTQLFRAQG